MTRLALCWSGNLVLGTEKPSMLLPCLDKYPMYKSQTLNLPETHNNLGCIQVNCSYHLFLLSRISKDSSGGPATTSSLPLYVTTWATDQEDWVCVCQGTKEMRPWHSHDVTSKEFLFVCVAIYKNIYVQIICKNEV